MSPVGAGGSYVALLFFLGIVSLEWHHRRKNSCSTTRLHGCTPFFTASACDRPGLLYQQINIINLQFTYKWASPVHPNNLHGILGEGKSYSHGNFVFTIRWLHWSLFFYHNFIFLPLHFIIGYWRLVGLTWRIRFIIFRTGTIMVIDTVTSLLLWAATLRLRRWWGAEGGGQWISLKPLMGVNCGGATSP